MNLPAIHRFARRLVLALAPVVMLGPLVAEAGVITQTGAFSLSSANGQFDKAFVPFARFDPAQGTLTAARFVMDSDTQTSASIKITGGGPGGVAGSQGVTVAIGAAVLAVLTDPLVDEPSFAGFLASCSSPGPACSDGRTEQAPVDVVVDVADGELANLVGLGTFEASLGSNFGTLTGAFGDPEFGDCIGTCVGSGAFSWIGTLSLTYVFTPAAVPEPMTAALLGIGLAGLALARRRSTPADASSFVRRRGLT